MTIPSDSPARPTIDYHYYRIIIESGDAASVRRGIDDLLELGRLSPSVVNLFRSQRMMAAPDLTDFLRFAVRYPVLITRTDDIAQEPPRPDRRFDWQPNCDKKLGRLDADSVRLLNHRSPLRVLRQTAFSAEAPAHLRRELLLASFVRATMLDEDASDLARGLGEADPKLEQFTQAYIDAQGTEARRFSAVFLILHQPEARPSLTSNLGRHEQSGRIESYRDNWWCALDLPIELDSPRYMVTSAGVPRRVVPAQTPPFLRTEDLADAEAEFGRVAAQGAGADYMGRVVLAWAKDHQDDNRLPEALHLVVRAGRYGCADTNTWKVTRDAFRVLHKSWPRSQWAKKTPTWWKEYGTVREYVEEQKER